MNKVNPAVVSIRHLTCRISSLYQKGKEIMLVTKFKQKDNQSLSLTQ